LRKPESTYFLGFTRSRMPIWSPFGAKYSQLAAGSASWPWTNKLSSCYEELSQSRQITLAARALSCPAAFASCG
jgi:hypothetical protein